MQLLASKCRDVVWLDENRFQAQCPICKDDDSNLMAKRAGEHVTLACFAGHVDHEILHALNLTTDDLKDPPPKKEKAPPPRPPRQESPSNAQPRAQADFSRRPPPQNLEAEQSVLGAVLLDNEALANARQVISVGDFYRDTHRTLFSAFCELIDAGKPVDAVTIGTWLRAHNKQAQIGPDYIAEVAALVPTSSNVQYYAELVREASTKRHIAENAAAVLELAHNGVASESLLGEWERRLKFLDRSSMPARSVLVIENSDEAAVSNAEYLSRPAIVGQLYYSQAISIGVGGKHEGKTTATRTEALSVASGLEVYGRPTLQTPVIYAASSDEYATTRMALLEMGWERHRLPLRLIRIKAEDNPEPEAVLAQLAREAEKEGSRFVVLDMLFDFIPVADELKYAHTRQAVGMIQTLADIIKGHVKATHHSPKWMPDAASAAKAVLGSQGVAARFSPVLLSRRWTDELFTIESTMTRDPRGVPIKPSVIVRRENGWCEVTEVFKDWMKWRLYRDRIVGLFEGQPGTEKNVWQIAEALGISRHEVQNAVFQMSITQEDGSPGVLTRVRGKGRGGAFKYRLTSDPEVLVEEPMEPVRPTEPVTGKLWTPPGDRAEEPESDLDEYGISRSQ